MMHKWKGGVLLVWSLYHFFCNACFSTMFSQNHLTSIILFFVFVGFEHQILAHIFCQEARISAFDYISLKLGKYYYIIVSI